MHYSKLLMKTWLGAYFYLIYKINVPLFVFECVFVNPIAIKLCQRIACKNWKNMGYIIILSNAGVKQ